MNTKSDQTCKKTGIEIPPIDAVKAAKELQQRLEAVKDEVRRLEESKFVSQETMKLEVSI